MYDLKCKKCMTFFHYLKNKTFTSIAYHQVIDFKSQTIQCYDSMGSAMTPWVRDTMTSATYCCELCPIATLVLTSNDIEGMYGCLMCD